MVDRRASIPLLAVRVMTLPWTTPGHRCVECVHELDVV